MAFFVLLLVTGGLLSYPSTAASTIKKIGGIANNDASGDVTKQSMIKLTTTTPSANTLSLSSQNRDSNTATTLNSATSPRLPGLHSNIVKNIGAKLTANSDGQSNGGNGNKSDLSLSSKLSGNVISTSNKSDLAQRVLVLESEMSNKQDILAAGDGISIDDSTIGLTSEYASLPDAVDDINAELDDLNERIQAVELTDLEPIISQLSNISIVKDFDPRFLDEPKVQP